MDRSPLVRVVFTDGLVRTSAISPGRSEQSSQGSNHPNLQHFAIPTERLPPNRVGPRVHVYRVNLGQCLASRQTGKLPRAKINSPVTSFPEH
jgi:hypothetical protein